MPPPESLPEDIRELVYRNGFGLGHGTWESDVSEMARRLGLSKDSGAPAHAPPVAEVNNAKWAALTSFKTFWLVTTFVVIATISLVIFYRKDYQHTSRGEISVPLQQPGGSPPEKPAGVSTGQPEGVSFEQRAETLSAGSGVIAIANLKTRTAEVYDQSSAGDNRYVAGYVGRSLRRRQRSRFLPVPIN